MKSHTLKQVSRGRVIPSLPSILLSGLMGCGIWSAINLEAGALPRAENSSSAPRGSFTLQNVFVPPNDALPEGSRTRGAASRSPSCLQTDKTTLQRPAAVLPASNYGLTLQSRPVFLVYVPELPADTHSFFFHIRDEQGVNVYGTFLPIAEHSDNILRIPLPEEAPLLELGEEYKWSVAIPCSGDLEPDTPFVSGWIERIEGGTPEETSSLSAIEKVYQYGQGGIWYDMMALLDELNRHQPLDTETMMVWQETLRWIGIDESFDIVQ